MTESEEYSSSLSCDDDDDDIESLESETKSESDPELDEEFLTALSPYFDTSSVNPVTKIKEKYAQFKETRNEKKELSRTKKTKKQEAENEIKNLIQKRNNLMPSKNWHSLGWKNIPHEDEIIQSNDPRVVPGTRAFNKEIEKKVQTVNDAIDNIKKQMKNASPVNIQKSPIASVNPITQSSPITPISSTIKSTTVASNPTQPYKKPLPPTTSKPSPPTKSKPSSSSIGQNPPPTTIEDDETPPPVPSRDSSNSSYRYMNASQPILTFPYATTFHNSRSHQYYVPSSSYNNSRKNMTANEDDDTVSF